ncbi:hypothetical protein Pmgp_00821 [Pelotomaculum propionicicum]|uniref:Uncharacterized protein n=1 Tax=Pelotomaculum propionicicum TaxID=258475 RepID=A0A4Y7RUP2_9FIRM|nr:hypothetical protein Pmgp_00821 [Pelotomaculum propionicicum]
MIYRIFKIYKGFLIIMFILQSIKNPYGVLQKLLQI